MAKAPTSTKRPPKYPPPPADLPVLVTTIVWPKDRTIHRIHPEAYGSAQFNPGVKGNARFSPIKTTSGNSIATIYGGSTFACAAMETIFHDVPFVPGLKTYDIKKLNGQVCSEISPTRDLTLIDLSSTSLRRLGVKRKQLIDTEKAGYPHTRKWAEAIYSECPNVDGLLWVSRQDDTAVALMLYGDRVKSTDLHISRATRDILKDRLAFNDVLALAIRIGVDIIGTY